MMLPDSVSGAYRWSYEAAYNVLSDPEISQKELNALSEFCSCHLDQLSRCWKPFTAATDASKQKLEAPSTLIFQGKTKISDIPAAFKEDATVLGTYLDVDHTQILEFIIAHTESHLVMESAQQRIKSCIILFYKEWRFLIKCLSKLILIGLDSAYSQKYDPQVVDVAKKIVSRVFAGPQSIELWENALQIVSYKLLGPTPVPLLSNSFLDEDLDAQRLFDSEWTLRCIELANLYITSATVLPTDKEIVKLWMRLAANTEMFTFFIEDKVCPAASDKLRALCVTAVVAAFDLELRFAKEPSHFTRDPEAMSVIESYVDTIVKSQFSSSLIVLVWSLALEQLAILQGTVKNADFLPFLHYVAGQRLEDFDSKGALKKRGKRRSSGDPFRTPISKTVSTDPVILMDMACERIHSLVLEFIDFSLRSGALQLLIDLVKHLSHSGDESKLLYLDVFRGLLQTFMPYSSLTDDLFLAIEATITPYPAIREKFYNNDYTEYSLEIAGSHFPLDMIPYLKLQTLASGTEIYQNLSNFPYTTVRIPHQFKDYTVSGDSFLLLSDFCIMEPRALDKTGDIYIPRDTTGVKIDIPADKTELIVAFRNTESKWPYLFRRMENAAAQIDDPVYSAEFDCIVNLLISTVSDLAPSQLRELIAISHDTMAYGDFIQLTFKALDQALEQTKLSFASTYISLIKALVSTVPERIWSALYRSKILGDDGRSSVLETILGTVELVKCDYSFTLLIIDLIFSLVNSTLMTIFDDKITVKARSSVLKAFVLYLVSLYESYGSWRYNYPIQRTEISSKIVEIFSIIVTSCYNIDFSTPMNERVTSVFSDVCVTILQRFLDSTDSSIRTTQPCYRAIETFSSKSWSASSSDASIYYAEDLKYTSSILSFSALLVRVRQMQQLPPSQLEDRLFRFAPGLVEIFDTYPTLRPAVARLLDALVAVPWSGTSSPSLLAFLGPAHSYIFSMRLTYLLESALESDAILYSTYFISSIIGGKQEGFTIFLVTGKQRVDDLSGRSGLSVNVDVPLMKALEQVVVKHNEEKHIFESELLAPILDVLCLAHSSWNGSPYNQEVLYLALVNIIFEYSSLNHLPMGPRETDAYHDMSMQNHIAARAMQIIAIQLYKFPKEPWVKKLFERLQNDMSLSKISENSLKIKSFRHSLHINLHKNFESKWQGLKLSMFTRSELQRRGRFDTCNIYDIRLLDIILGTDPVWLRGYRDEVLAATLNLQYVESQFQLIEGWCTTLNVMASVASEQKNIEFLEKLQKVQEISLEAVLYNDISVSMFNASNMRRLELAYYIMMLLSKQGILVTSLDSVNKAFDLISQGSVDFMSSVSQISQNHYFYLMILKIMNLQLSSLASNKQVLVETDKAYDAKKIKLIQGIVDLVAIRGMKLICRAAQSDSKVSYTDELIVTTLILRQCLDTPGIELVSSAWVFTMTETDCCKAVMGLFSTCMSRSFKNMDAHYGELTMLYLQEWLRIESMADHFISVGLLRLLYESPVSRILQSGNVEIQNLKFRRIWRSILGLVIQLIRQLNGLILPDMIIWLNSFSTQINQGLAIWNEVPKVSFALIEETSQILLIIYLIRRLCESENSDLMTKRLSTELLVDPLKMLNQLDFLLDHKQFLEEQIVLLTVEEQQKYGKEKEKAILVEDISQEIRDLRDLIVQMSNKLQPV